jgi:RimJ/RimL family protein N-acetyltransferase
MIRLHSIFDNDDYKFLFKLLKERPAMANISHSKLPSYKKHCDFVQQNPYKMWFIVWIDNNRVGSVYLTTNNEIGIAVDSKWQGKGIAKWAIKKIMSVSPEKGFLANIAPQNDASRNLFEGLGFKFIQETYRLS